jgi:hypothetical protein
MSRSPEAGVAAGLVQVNNAYWADATLGRMVTDIRVGVALSGPAILTHALLCIYDRNPRR